MCNKLNPESDVSMAGDMIKKGKTGERREVLSFGEILVGLLERK